MSGNITRDVIDFLKTLPEEYQEKKISCIISENDDKSDTPVSNFVPVLKKKNKQKQNRIPRPPNAFILYRKSKQSSLSALDEEISNNDASKLIGKMWHNESEAEKQRWHQMAIQKKLEHMQLYPEYKYHPRRPSEKPKRKKRKEFLVENPKNDLPGSVNIPTEHKNQEIQPNILYTNSMSENICQSQNVIYDAQLDSGLDMNNIQIVEGFPYTDLLSDESYFLFPNFFYAL